MTAAPLLRQVVARRCTRARSSRTQSAVVAVRACVVTTQSGVATGIPSTTVARAAVRCVVLPVQSFRAHTWTAAALLTKVIPGLRSRTILHWTLVCIAMETGVKLTHTRVGARFRRATVTRAAMRRVVLTA